LPSTDLSARVAASWQRLPAPAGRIRVGLSGGLDSTVLLHLLAGLREQFHFDLTATHVSHGLVPGSAAWGDVCRGLCERLDVPFAVRDVTVDRAHPGGLEAAARDARRAVLLEGGADWLALAHHRDDQAETVLFRALRGAGVRGAAGMRAIVPGGGKPGLWRPLLEVPRSALMAHATAHDLGWIDDPSNADSHFSRNFLRNEVLPAVSARFPGAAAGLARLGRLAAEASDLLDALADADLAALVTPGSTRYRRSSALGLSSPRLRNLLRRALAAAGEAMPDEDALCEVERQFRADAAPAGLRLPVGASALCIYRDEWWLEAIACSPAPDAVGWSGEPTVDWAGGEVCFQPATGQGLSAALQAGQPCALRRRTGGERMRLNPAGPSRSLKNLLQEAGVPGWLRDGLPLFWVGERLAWIAGVGVAAEFVCPPGEKGWLPVWSRWPGEQRLEVVQV
jgi:tRNA(Ile)-lysidine synthase